MPFGVLKPFVEAVEAYGAYTPARDVAENSAINVPRVYVTVAVLVVDGFGAMLSTRERSGAKTGSIRFALGSNVLTGVVGITLTLP